MKPEHRPIFDALSDEQLLALCIEREAGGEPIIGKIAVGTVIMERVDHRKWDGENIQEVVLLPWQFSWTMPEAGKEYYLEAVQIAANWDQEYKQRSSLQISFGIAVGMLSGEIPRDPDLARVHCCQYLNPQLAARTRKRWLAKGMRTVKVIQNHEFFVEA